METIDRRSILEATPGLLALLFLAVSGGIDPDGVGAWIRGVRPTPPSAAHPRSRARTAPTRDTAPRPAVPAAPAPPPVVSAGLQAEEPSPGAVRITVTTAPAAAARRVEINRATKRELERLPGIGPVKAAAILSARTSRGGRFGSWEELELVPGIGPKTLERIRREATL